MSPNSMRSYFIPGSPDPYRSPHSFIQHLLCITSTRFKGVGYPQTTASCDLFSDSWLTSQMAVMKLLPREGSTCGDPDADLPHSLKGLIAVPSKSRVKVSIRHCNNPDGRDRVDGTCPTRG